MKQELFSEYRALYGLNWGHVNIIRIRIRMRDLIDPVVLRHAVNITMKRYPYYCGKLQKNEEGKIFFVENPLPIVISHSYSGVKLNTSESNDHIVSFSYVDNWLAMDIPHIFTDGIGAYEVIRTLLYYYVNERYDVQLPKEEIWLYGDAISAEEWEDPLLLKNNLPAPVRTEMLPALNLLKAGGLEDDFSPTVYNVAVSEKEFMRFNIHNDGSPATMVSLLLSRALAKLFPDSDDIIRVMMTVNMRKALNTPRAHQSLVGGINLEYKKQMKHWSLDRQATAYRGMVFLQTQEEKVLETAASIKSINQMILSKKNDEERLALSDMIGKMAGSLNTIAVSYVGKANFGNAEKYIRDFRLWTYNAATPVLVEISAVNGRFTLDFLQSFSSPIIVNAFLKELDENDIIYDLQDVEALKLPDVALPWR